MGYRPAGWQRDLVVSYIPDRGDIVWTNFDPQLGHEQAGSRPALILSRKLFNEASGLALFCPITGRQKGYPFEVHLPPNPNVYGVVLLDHLKSLDWQSRPIEFVAKAPEVLLDNVVDTLKILIS